MKTLADEILEALPSMVAAHPMGPTVAEVCARLNIGPSFAREAMTKLDADKRALLVRWPGSKRRHLVQLDGLPKRHAACGWCGVVFARKPKSKAICCCRSHSNAWAWSRPGATESRSAALRAAKDTPQARAHLAAHNAKRWANPEERERLSEQNRRQWADPQKAALRSAAIQAVHGAPEKRLEASRKRKLLWEDPEYRERAVAGIRRSKSTPEAREKFSELMKARWQDPVMRAKYTAANAVLCAAMAERNRGRKQSPEQIRKRVKAARRTKEARGRDS